MTRELHRSGKKSYSLEIEISNKLFLTIFIILLITILLFGLFTFIREKNHLELEINESMENLAHILPGPLWNIQDQEISLIGEIFFQDPDVLQITIIDLSREKTIVNLTQEDKYADSGIAREKDLYMNNRIIGQVSVIFSREEISSQLSNLLTFSIIISIVVVISIILINKSIFKTNFKKPINQLMEIISSYSDNPLNADSDAVDYIEFKPLIDVFNEMKEKIIKDNEERMKNLEALQKSEKNLKTILDSIGDGVIATDKNSLITDMNRVAQRLTGYSLNDAIGMPLKDIYRKCDSITGRSLSNPVEKILNGGILPKEINHSLLVNRNGSTYQITDSASPIENMHGELVGVVIAFSDITEEMLLQEQLSHKNRMDSIGQLAGGIAHDFNNMLSGIMNSAHLLKSPGRNLDKSGLKYVDIILQASKRAADLTSKLLSYGRKSQATYLTVDIHRIIDETAEILRRTVDKKIIVTVEKKAKVPFVMGDSTELQNTILNLCINSSQAMPEGGNIQIISKNINLRDHYCKSSSFNIEPGQYCEIEVLDSGCGIPAESLNKIFEPFYTTKGMASGSGLGLAAVYGTIESHQGEISVYSEIGYGTSFIIKLPCTKAYEMPVEQIDEQIVHGSGTILVVDDEDIIRITVEHMLNSMGYEVILAKNGLHAVEIYSERFHEIDLVLMDMIMPVMNGRDAYERIREINPECITLISSGFSKDENIRNLKEKGLAGFIRKPFRDYELSQMIAKFLKQKDIP